MLGNNRHSLKKIPRIHARFSFFAVTGALLCTDRAGTALMCLCACLLHEGGHLIMMMLRRRPPDSITFYGGGIHISGGGSDILSAAGGCAMNLLLFLCFYFYPGSGFEAKLFGVVNLLLAAFNLLPINGLDGKLLLDKALLRAFPAEIAMKVSRIFEIAVCALIIPSVILLVFSGYLSFSAIVFFFYLMIVDALC